MCDTRWATHGGRAIYIKTDGSAGFALEAPPEGVQAVQETDAETFDKLHSKSSQQ